MTDWLGPAEWQAVALSLRVSFWATLVSLPLGIWVAFALARWSFPGKQLLNGIVHLPLILPPVVTGYVLLLTLGPQGPVGSILADWGIVLAFRWTGAAVAAAVMAFPLMVRAIRLSIEAIDPKLEQASATLGAAAHLGVSDRHPAHGAARHYRGRDPCFLQKRWANSAQRSPSFPTYPGRPAPSPRPSTPFCKCRGARAQR